VDEVTAGAGGSFTATVPTLFAGQRVTATAIGAGEVESVPSAAVAVEGTSAGTGPSTTPAQCADGLDNDGDGDVDYPEDASCVSFLDDTEGNTPECEDGVDNDDDGQTDADDPDCATGNGETGVPACADGIDNDGDGKIDYPSDPQCSGPTDGDEEQGGTQQPGSGGNGGGDGSGEGSGGAAGGSTTPVDLGGIDEGDVRDPSGGDESGCGCRVAGQASPGQSRTPFAWLALVGLSGAWLRRRRRGSL
jgi:MYXO-CTERM domain-containing protein